MKVDLEERKAVLVHNHDVISASDVAERIDDIGFECDVLSDGHQLISIDDTVSKTLIDFEDACLCADESARFYIKGIYDC